MTGYRLLRAADRRIRPWKNGGGTTTDVIVHPPGADIDDFGWRISIADILEEGPFSGFPGVQRILTVLDGELELTFVADGGSCMLDTASEPFAFSGDVPVLGRPSRAPLKDVNVMTRFGRFTARVTRIASANALALGDDAGGIAVLLALDPIELELLGEAIALDPLDAIALAAPWQVQKVADGSQRPILVEIRPT